VADRATSWVSHMRDETLQSLREGQRDGRINPKLDAEATAHTIIIESLGDAYLWTVEPEEPYRRRTEQWRALTVQMLEP
jgi:hypothetical protein